MHQVMIRLALCLSLLSPAAWPAEKTPKIFSFRISGEISSLDWNRASANSAVLMNIMEGLVSLGPDLKVHPALAESWTLSPNRRIYTFKLRPGVKWSDGQPLKAADFVYSWRRLLSPMVGANFAYELFDIEGARLFNSGKLRDFESVGVKALDDRTLQVTLARPVPFWLYIPTLWPTFPLRQDVVEASPDSWFFPGKAVTLGPFLLSSRDQDARYILKANPAYYGARGNVDEVRAEIVKEDSQALKLYEEGKLDLLGDLASAEMIKVAKRPDARAFMSQRTFYLTMFTKIYPMSNVHLRRAVAMAIDRTKITASLLGRPEIAGSFVPQRIPGHTRSIGLPYDPVKAKKEFALAGLDLGKPPQLELMFPKWEIEFSSAQVIQNELEKNLGLKILLKPRETKDYREQRELELFPMMLQRWTAHYPDPSFHASIFTSESGNNRAGWKNPKYDELVANARENPDPKAREKIYLQAQKLLIEEEAVILPLFYEPNLVLVKPRVKNLEIRSLNRLILKDVRVAD